MLLWVILEITLLCDNTKFIFLEAMKFWLPTCRYYLVENARTFLQAGLLGNHPSENETCVDCGQPSVKCPVS